MASAFPELVESRLSVEEFFALPDDDGIDRMLIRGRLWEKPMTKRNRWHSSCEAAIARLIGNWVKEQPKPRGRVYSGEAGFLLRRTPASAVGIDVAYASYEVIQQCDESTRMVNGPPILAVEILSPSDQQEEIIAKIREYLHVGVALIWVVEPEFRTVTVYRPDEQPKMFYGTDVLSGNPQMPGFQIQVNDIFEE